MFGKAGDIEFKSVQRINSSVLALPLIFSGRWMGGQRSL